MKIQQNNISSLAMLTKVEDVLTTDMLSSASHTSLQYWWMTAEVNTELTLTIICYLHALQVLHYQQLQ